MGSARRAGHQQWNRYAYARNNPLIYTDPDGRAAVGITFALYRVDTGWGFRAPLWHSGVLTIDDKTGKTRYFESGRYSPRAEGVMGARKSTHEGNIREVNNVPKAIIGKDGKPTKDSLNKIYAFLSSRAGQNKPVIADYRPDADAQQVESFVRARASDEDRLPYAITSNNCTVFTFEALKAGEKPLK